MTKHDVYTYTILRYVHDVMLGEFVNVGLVVQGIGGVKARMLTRSSRVANVFPGLDAKSFKSSIKSIGLAIAANAIAEETAGMFQTTPDALAFARRALVSDDSSFQWSPLGSGISVDLSATLDQLYDRFVARYEKQTAQRRGDAEIWKPIRKQLEELNVADKFTEQTFRGAVDEFTMDHAWKNGRWHAIEAYSLDLADDTEVKQKARTIRGHLDSLHDGFTEDLSLNLILGVPANLQLSEAFNVAIKILQGADFKPNVVVESEAPALVEQLAREIQGHDAGNPPHLA